MSRIFFDSQGSKIPAFQSVSCSLYNLFCVFTVIMLIKRKIQFSPRNSILRIFGWI